MSFADYLTESPFVIPQTDFDLGDSKINMQRRVSDLLFQRRL